MHPFDTAVAIAVAENRMPEGHHGAVLPEKMPWVGDMFFLEHPDGETVTLYVWGNGWDKGPDLKRKPAKAITW